MRGHIALRAQLAGRLVASRQPHQVGLEELEVRVAHLDQAFVDLLVDLGHGFVTRCRDCGTQKVETRGIEDRAA